MTIRRRSIIPSGTTRSAGAAFSWQVMYLLIAWDVVRYRPIMLLGAAAKSAFLAAMIILYLQQRLVGSMVGIATPDGVLAAFFVAAWLRTPGESMDARY